MVLQLSACGGISVHNYKAHSDNNLSEDAVSILHVTRNNYVKRIDGKGSYSPSHISDLSPYIGAKIELLPGTHTLSLKYSKEMFQGSSHTKENNDFNFTFLSGKQYFLYSTIEHTRTQKGIQYNSVFHIDECGTENEKIYNENEQKYKSLFGSYVPACGM